MRYEDFILRIGPGAGSAYEIQVDSPAGEGQGTFEIPQSTGAPAGSETAPSGGTTREVVKGGSHRPAASARQAGIELYQALFQGEVANLFHDCLGRLADGDRGLRIKVEIDARLPRLEPLQNLPWELLCRPDTREPLGLSERTPIVRVLRVPRERCPGLSRSTRLRVLVVPSSPSDLPPLDLAQERRNLEEAWRRQTAVELVFLARADREELRRVLRKASFQVLCFMGHGGFDPATGEGSLFFEKPDGTADPVSGSALARELNDIRSLRLVVLNACHTARAESAFAGVASALVLGGVPAVVAMRRPITDRAAVAFSRVLWERLAAGDPLEAAMVEARLAIHRLDETSDEWATPVLFLRTREEASVQRYAALLAAALGLAILAIVLGLGWVRDLRAGQVRRSIDEGIELRGQKQPEKAREAFLEALRLDPDNGVAHAHLSVLEEEEGNYADALAHAQAAVEAGPSEAFHHYNLGNLLARLGRVEEALGSLREAVRLEPGYGEAYNEIGNLYLDELDLPVDARLAFDNGLRADPELPPLHKNVARAALAEGKLDEAVRSLEKARSLYAAKDLSGLPETFYWLAEAHARAGRRIESCRALSDLRLQEPAGPWQRRGEGLAQQIGCDGVS
jgi:tetratricopeptide (TPR) repeat protein